MEKERTTRQRALEMASRRYGSRRFMEFKVALDSLDDDAVEMLVEGMRDVARMHLAKVYWSAQNRHRETQFVTNTLSRSTAREYLRSIYSDDQQVLDTLVIDDVYWCDTAHDASGKPYKIIAI